MVMVGGLTQIEVSLAATASQQQGVEFVASVLELVSEHLLALGLAVVIGIAFAAFAAIG